MLFWSTSDLAYWTTNPTTQCEIVERGLIGAGIEAILAHFFFQENACHSETAMADMPQVCILFATDTWEKTL